MGALRTRKIKKVTTSQDDGLVGVLKNILESRMKFDNNTITYRKSGVAFERSAVSIQSRSFFRFLTQEEVEVAALVGLQYGVLK
jgi:hypothetical protein